MKTRSLTVGEALVVLAIGITVLAMIAVYASHKVDVEAYDAWVKITGNPHDLTWRQWHILSYKKLLPTAQEGRELE